MESFDPEDAASIEQATECLRTRNIQTQLAFIKNNFSYLIHATKMLENPNISLSLSIKLYEDARKRLRDLPNTKYATKFEKIRNRGYETLKQISRVLNGEIETSQVENAYIADLSPSEFLSFSHCPTTSCDVERTFSIYKTILTDRRHKLTPDNLKKILILNCNSSCCDDTDDSSDSSDDSS